MPSIFTKIINGEIPSFKIYEDDRFYAFLDINPMALGHTLVIPKVEVDYIFDLTTDIYSGLMLTAKQISSKLEQAVPCKRVGMLVYGLEVPHAHVHLIPINNENDMKVDKKIYMSMDELKELGETISALF